MAYGQIYELKFKNRIQNDIWRVEIWQKDYVGDVTELEGSEQPVLLSYDDAEILEPIKSCSLTLSFLTATSLLETFYSDDDEEFRIDLYFESLSDGSGTEKLLFTGYLIQDGVSEPLTDRKHVITLKATDNLALLKSVKWDEASINMGQEYYGKHPLHYFIRTCLTQTGLYNNGVTIPMSLPLRIFSNLFENTTDDRSDDPISDPFVETIIDAAIFQSTDNTWDDCYTVLEKILTDLNACLLQADGYWNIVRPGEYELFDAGEIPGTQYHYNGVDTDVTAVTLLPYVSIAGPDRGGDCYPVEEDQSKSLQRPYKYVLNTFNYNQPGSFILNQDLQLPTGAIPFDTETIGDFRYDRYPLSTYFPDWVQRGDDISYLEIVTNISVTPESEEDRYIVTPSPNNGANGVQFNPIPVTKGDVFDFSLQYRTFTDTDQYLNFGVRFEVIGEGATSYDLIDFPSILISPDATGLVWDEISSDAWNSTGGVHLNISDAAADDIDTTQYQMYSLSGVLAKNRQLPLIPADGMLLITVFGTNAAATTENTTTLWKDVTLNIQQFVNTSTQVIGQTHQDIGISTIKATNESDLVFDDSPRNTIAGTLFTNELTSFDHTDTISGEQTLIGSIYFTRTRTWHRADGVEALRLGNIIAYERLKMRYTTRLIIEGTFRNLRYADDRFISMLSLFQFDFIADKFFLAKSLEIDYMNCSYRATLVETYSGTDDLPDEYLFNYYYKTD